MHPHPMPFAAITSEEDPLPAHVGEEEEDAEVWRISKVNKTLRMIKGLGEIIRKHLVQPRNRAATRSGNPT